MKQNQLTIKDIENIEKNPETLLKIKPTRFSKSAKKYLNGLTLKDFAKKDELVINIINAYHIDNTRVELNLLKKYNIKFAELISIAPKLYQDCTENPRNIEGDIKAGKYNHEIKKLNNKGIKITWKLLFLMHANHKSTKAIKKMKIDEINKYLGIVRHFFHTKGKMKTTKLINKLYDIIYPGLEDEKKLRPTLNKQQIIK